MWPSVPPPQAGATISMAAERADRAQRLSQCSKPLPNDWNLDESGSEDFSLLVAANVFMNAEDPERWFANVFARCRYFVLVRSRSTASSGGSRAGPGRRPAAVRDRCRAASKTSTTSTGSDRAFSASGRTRADRTSSTRSPFTSSHSSAGIYGRMRLRNVMPWPRSKRCPQRADFSATGSSLVRVGPNGVAGICSVRREAVRRGQSPRTAGSGRAEDGATTPVERARVAASW